MGMRSRVLAIAWIAAHALLSFTAPAAAEPGATPSYNVKLKGQIDIAEDGSVIDYQLENELPKGVADAFGRSIMGWRFDPVLVEGKPARVQARMIATLGGEPTSAGGYNIRLIDAQFGSFGNLLNIVPPRYPLQAIQSLIGARAVMIVRVDAAGNVTQVHTQQVDLYGDLKSSKKASVWREKFARASTRTVREWKVVPRDPMPGAADYSVAFAVDFALKGDSRWSARPLYGPVVGAPWMTHPSVPVENDYLANLVKREGTPEPEPGSFLYDLRFRLQGSPIGSLL